MGAFGGLILAVVACFFFGIIGKSGSHLFFGCLFLLILMVGLGFSFLLWAGH